MPNSLLTGVSGLIAHQRLLDVVGHNIANINTHGYKADRMLFADLLYETLTPAARPGESQGGVNANQIGGGVKVFGTEKKFTQGALEQTGEQFDLAISGEGFFVVNDGTNDFYTRTGIFAVDEAGMLSTVNGLYAKRLGSAGEPDGINPAFQVPGDDRIRIPERAAVAGVQTQNITLAGNLNANETEAKAELQTSNLPYSASGAVATGATLLNDLDSNETNYVVGDRIVIDGLNPDGTAINHELAVSAATTMQDVVDQVNTLLTGASARIEADGRLVVEADDVGPSFVELRLRDASTNVGRSQFLSHDLFPLVEGKAAGAFEKLTVIHDVQGRPHELKLRFTKLGPHDWRMDASMDPAAGVVTDSSIETISFNDDGSLRATSDAEIAIQFDGLSSPQMIRFNISDPQSTDRLTHNASQSDLQINPDGSPPGVITDIQVKPDGRIVGSASNGEIFTIAQMAIANFRNEKGLLAVADNLYSQSLNSGTPEVGVAGSSGRGSVEAGRLETSNVDVAFEFTRLIVAQRGFSANARTITVSDEVLEELTNIIR